MMHAGARPSGQILVFGIDSGRFGVPAADVREVLRAVAIAPLPRAPWVIDGVIDVRGEPVPVLNLRRRFGRPHRELDPSERFILVWAGARTIALRVDHTGDMAAVPAEAMRIADAVVPGAPYVAGVATLADGLVLIHDPAAFLSQVEADELEQALAADHAAALSS
jgi:purine-binding chemotaxis protein CheW